MIWTDSHQAALLALIQQRNERDVLQKQLQLLQTDLQQRQAQQSTLYETLLKEEGDVDRLQRFSWAKLYYDLLNRREAQLTKEQAEAEAALSQYESVCEYVTDLKGCINELTQKLEPFAHLETGYDKLIEQKTGFLLVQQGAVYEQYKGHLLALEQADKHVQEMREAHSAGLKALEEVLQLRKLLDEALSWGNWDMWAGSVMSSMVKHQKLDAVRQQSRWVNLALQRFQAEYADVHRTMEADWQFDDNLTRFVDIFFDNFLTDWSVQRRIEQANQDARTLEQRLVVVIKQIKADVEQAVVEAQERNSELRQFLEQV
ncbi:hypothetical protein F5984_22615 [Rudanella paleaurantiibacter]|uniref:Uncharacterized protein n=1 Tax=Rudanella paleaurantiibacter TaxID=2614655 RepID=A0A7J5TTF8_9BACT|nr:hypothetical protein [Rudanella paleaurantiibacter]KAB7727034.1 hypothetical protein F5984_22615 [Rudanella paleaurantiibacter]